MTATILGTASGRLIDLASPQPEDICLRDIAAHLAKINRYTGATCLPLSVAQHSVVVAEHLERHHGPMLGLHGLLHDAHEAYIGDLTRPVSCLLARVLGRHDVWGQIVMPIDAAIWQHFGISMPVPDECRLIDEADNRALATEWRDLMPAGMRLEGFTAEPLPRVIKPLPWARAEEMFLETAERLGIAASLPALKR